MTSPRWMFLVCFSLISVFGTGESLTIVRSPKSEQIYIPAIIADMTKAIANLNTIQKKLVQRNGISCSSNQSLIQTCNTQKSLLSRRLATCDLQLKSVSYQRTTLQQQVNILRSQLFYESQQRNILQSRMNVFAKYQNEGWQYFRGSLYFFSTTVANWQDSRNFCTTKGADLVVIEDAAENNFARGIGRKSWIGLMRQGFNWIWVNGKVLSPSASFWAPKEPNNVGNQEDRVELQLFNIPNCWNDEPQATRNFWICEKKIF